VIGWLVNLVCLLAAPRVQWHAVENTSCPDEDVPYCLTWYANLSCCWYTVHLPVLAASWSECSAAAAGRHSVACKYAGVTYPPVMWWASRRWTSCITNSWSYRRRQFVLECVVRCKRSNRRTRSCFCRQFDSNMTSLISDASLNVSRWIGSSRVLWLFWMIVLTNLGTIYIFYDGRGRKAASWYDGQKIFYARKQLLSVRLSVTRVDQSKAVQARITKSSPSAAWKTLVSGPVKLFHKSKGVTPNEGAK